MENNNINTCMRVYNFNQHNQNICEPVLTRDFWEYCSNVNIQNKQSQQEVDIKILKKKNPPYGIP